MTPRSRLGAYRRFEERTASISTLKMLLEGTCLVLFDIRPF